MKNGANNTLNLAAMNLSCAACICVLGMTNYYSRYEYQEYPKTDIANCSSYNEYQKYSKIDAVLMTVVIMSLFNGILGAGM